MTQNSQVVHQLPKSDNQGLEDRRMKRIQDLEEKLRLQSMPEQRSSKMACYRCGETGHFKRDCKKPRSGKLTASAAVSSHTVGASTGIPAIDSLRGSCPVSTMTIEGQKIPALVDTGSEVSTITETVYRRKFGGLRLQSAHWLSLKAANGLDIPYLGLLEAQVTVFGGSCRASLLVVKDPKDPHTRSRKESVPAILGMNILQQVLGTSFDGQGATMPSWLQAVVEEVRTQGKPLQGIARVVGSVRVLAESMMAVRVSGINRPGQRLVAEPSN